MTDTGWKLTLTGVFLALNGFFVAAEFALVKLRPGQVAQLARDGNAGARLLEKVLAHLDLYLSACQLGITIASLVLGWLAEPAVASLLVQGLQATGLADGSEAWVHQAALAIALSAVTVLHVVAGEQAPKIWALKRSEGTALRIVWPLYGFTALFRPAIAGINALSNWVLRWLGLPSGHGEESAISPAEIHQLLLTAAEAGHLGPNQGRFMQRTLAIRQLQVRHIMVPRTDVCTVELGDGWPDITAQVRAHGHSRTPLCDGGLDEVLGILHVKDLFVAQQSGPPADIASLALPAVVVPATQSLSELIVELQSTRRHCAIVSDEHGTVVGMVFLEDALEEIVGPIQDEFDEEEPVVTRVSDYSIEIRGELSLPLARQQLGEPIEGSMDTLGGYVVAQLGRLPKVGDRVPVGRWTAEVQQVRRKRITKVTLTRPGRAPKSGASGSP